MASIKKRPDGQWRARYRDEAGKEHARHFGKKADAQNWLNQVTASLVSGSYVSPKAGRITFAQYFAEWSSRQIWVPGTEQAARLAADSVTFGDTPLAALRRSHIEAWVKTMTAPREGKPAGLAPGTIKTRVNYVRTALRAAVRDRVIAADPAEGIKLPRVRRAEAALEIPASQQVGAVYTASPPRWQAFVALCAFAGLRLGEAAALQVGDIDFLRRQMKVTRQVQRPGGTRVDIRAPKYGSERTVYLAAGLVEILAKHVAEHCPGNDPHRWLFTGRDGLPPQHNIVGFWWRRARVAAGCATVRLHDLRHFYASGLIAAGCDVVTVQRALGHASASVTLNTYAHLWPTAEDRTRKAASSVMAQALETGTTQAKAEPG